MEHDDSNSISDLKDCQLTSNCVFIKEFEDNVFKVIFLFLN